MMQFKKSQRQVPQNLRTRILWTLLKFLELQISYAQIIPLEILVKINNVVSFAIKKQEQHLIKQDQSSAKILSQKKFSRNNFSPKVSFSKVDQSSSKYTKLKYNSKSPTIAGTINQTTSPKYQKTDLQSKNIAQQKFLVNIIKNKKELNTSDLKLQTPKKKENFISPRSITSKSFQSESFQSESFQNDNSYKPLSYDIKKWNQQILPVNSEFVLANFSHLLMEIEHQEITNYINIFYIGLNVPKRKITLQKQDNGFDDQKGEYKFHKSDHIAYRYETISYLGQGSFGSVIKVSINLKKVFDHKRKELSAMKVIKSKKKFFQWALVELKILKYLKDQDPQDLYNLVRIKDFVIFRNHVCIVFELLNLNLYELLKKNNFKGLQLDVVRSISIQLLQSLAFLKKVKIIHCDIKPENILFKSEKNSSIKLVDFGSSCFTEDQTFTYLQSRFYRAPEIILGYPYDNAMDMWSLGLVIAEMLIGYPLFPGDDEQDQLHQYISLLGKPDTSYIMVSINILIQTCNRSSMYFDDKYQLISGSKNKSYPTQILSRVLNCKDTHLVDFIEKCLIWHPLQRMTATDVIKFYQNKALKHPWILKRTDLCQQNSCTILMDIEISKKHQEDRQKSDIKHQNYSPINQDKLILQSYIKQKMLDSQINFGKDTKF